MALDNEFILSELIVSGSSALRQTKDSSGNIVVDTRVDTDGESFGYVERPIYNEDQVKKAVDTIVDELISPKQKDTPAVVLKTIYDDLREQYNEALKTIKDLQKQLNEALQQIEVLNITIDDLNVQLDLEKLLRASAETERDVTNEKYVSTILDFQTALSKGIKEGIERVSIEAQVSGLLSEKEAFVEFTKNAQTQITNANNQIINLGNELNAAFTQLARAQGEAISAQNQAAASNAQTQVAAASAANNKKKGTIICTEMYNQSLMPEFIFDADRKFGYRMYKNNKQLLEGYWIWATPVVEWLKQNPKGSKLFYNIIVKHWSEHMAYSVDVLPKDNLFGKIIHNVGVKFTKLVYLYNKNKLQKLNYQWQ